MGERFAGGIEDLHNRVVPPAHTDAIDGVIAFEDANGNRILGLRGDRRREEGQEGNPKPKGPEHCPFVPQGLPVPL